MNTWFDIKAKADSKSGHDAEVLIFDEIGGWGISAKDFISGLKASKAKRPLVRINSPGGSVFDGIAIANYLRGLEATVQIDGLAASIAGIIALAGKEVRIAENGFFMIHNPWGVAVGDSEQMTAQAELLAKLEDTLANDYAAKSRKPIAEVKKWMADETWFTAAEAKAAGLVDTITETASFSASVRSFKSAPAALSQTKTPTPESMKDLLKALAGAGLLSSSELDDAKASAEFVAKYATVTADRDKFKTERDSAVTDRDALKAKLDAKAKRFAETVVASAIADGRIEASAKDTWIAKITADDTAADLLASITPRKPSGATHVPTEPNKPEKKTLTQMCIDARKAAASAK